MSYYYSTGTYNQCHPQYASSANVEQVESSFQNCPPAPKPPINFLYWNDPFLTPRSYLAPASATLPIQTSLSAVPVSPHSYLDVANKSRTLPVAAPVPVPHAALTKAALRTMMSFDDKGNITAFP